MVNFVQKLINTSKLRRVEHCCSCAELARGDKEKKYVYITVKLVKLQKKTLWLDLPIRKWREKKEIPKSFTKLSVYFSFTLFVFVASMEFLSSIRL